VRRREVRPARNTHGSLFQGGRCSLGERMLCGRGLCRWGGTGKAEAVKLPGAGIWPEAVPGKMRSRKRVLTEISEYRRQKQT
jgi:hypothetical protein